MTGLFDVSVGPLLNTYPGDSKRLEFNSTVPTGTWDDLEIVGPLEFEVDLIAIDNGVDAIIENLTCTAIYEGQEFDISIQSVDRTFVKVPDATLPDDINPIDMKHASIPLGKVLREEILMQLF